MIREEKNLTNSIKDMEDVSTSRETDISRTESVISAYTKTDKLITALYMVTDIIDKDEPLRNKLRTLGIGIISDINSAPINACSKIAEVMSFLDIALSLNIISVMNCSILKKEFSELSRSINDTPVGTRVTNRQINLLDFFKKEAPNTEQPSIKDKHFSIGHSIPTRIGVQKGSTLMKALSGVKMSNTKLTTSNTNSFDMLKKQRRFEIISLIQRKGGNASITDIKNEAYGSLVSCGEKTLQRELVSMVKDGVLNKTGEKRWSRYFLENRP